MFIFSLACLKNPLAFTLWPATSFNILTLLFRKRYNRNRNLFETFKKEIALNYCLKVSERDQVDR